MITEKESCRFHPTQSAIWSCDACNMSFCPNCVSSQDASGSTRCYLCKEELTQLAISSAIEPFWRQTNTFFSYAFHTPILMYCLFLAVIMLIPTPGTLVFWVALFFSYSSLMKLCSGICERISEGNLALPEWQEVLSFGKDMIFIRFILAGVALGSFFQWTFTILPMPLWYLIYFFVLIGLPAILILLVIENSVLAALNPGKMLFVMRGIGWPYAIFFGFAFILNTSTTAAVSMLGSFLPDYMIVSMAMFFTGYFACVFFSMMGYTLYQYHHELGFSIDSSILEQSLPTSTNSSPPWQTESEILIKEGRYSEAITCLEKAVKHNGKNLGAYEKLTKLYKYIGDKKQVLTAGQQYMALLAEAKMAAKADVIYRDILAINKNFQVDDADLCYKLARGFAQTGKAILALRICQNFHRRFPNFAKIDEVYWLLAKQSAEQLGNDGHATQLLEFIKTHFSKSRLIPEVDNYLLSLQSMKG